MKIAIHKFLGKPNISQFRFVGVFIFFLFTLSFCCSQEIATNKVEELPLEKVYLHLDRSYYTAGEDIWFKAYVMDARDHTPQTLSEIVYVELIGPNNQLISKKVLKTNKGSVAGDFKLPSASTSGIYTVTGYTNYMRNFGSNHFYSKEIFVNTANSPAVLIVATETKVESTLDVQFFPESGYLINGFLNPIAFKALDSNGNGTDITGKLIDGSGNLVTSFKSTHLGMGLFHFIPKANRTYYAMITFNNKEQRFEIPKPRSSGVLMTVSNQEDFYKIELRATKDLKMKDYLLLGKQGGTVRFSLNVNANKQENSAIVKVLKDILDEGILELTLVNQINKPIAERLLFHEKETGIPTAKITTDKDVYGKRVPVVMEISLDASDLAKTTADMSLSVSNLTVNATANNMTDIKTYLLLNSVVKGKIEQPGYYFYNKHPERRLNLDILMRTQGWRQYVLEEELATSSNYFLPEKGLGLSGQVVNASNPKETLTGSVSLTSNNASEMLQDKVETRSDGTFSFTNLNFSDTTNVLLSANVYYPQKKRNPTLNYKIILDTIDTASTSSFRIDMSKNNAPNEGSLYNSGKSMAQFTGAYEKAQETTLSYVYNDKTIQLDEAFIAAKKKPKALDKFEKKRQGMPYKEPSQTIDFDGLKTPPGQNTLLALRGRVPGLSLGSDRINIRGSSTLTGNNMPLILLDGIPIPIMDSSPSLDKILPMTAGEIDFIDILKGPRAAIYGSRAANGVIAIYTKNGTESAGKTTKAGGSLNIEHPGYAVSRTFYEPKYDNQQPHIEVDNRSTLYWQPFVALNDNGKAIISFYTGDMLGDYVVRLQGITIEGTPFYSQTLCSVE